MGIAVSEYKIDEQKILLFPSFTIINTEVRETTPMNALSRNTINKAESGTN